MDGLNQRNLRLVSPISDFSVKDPDRFVATVRTLLLVGLFGVVLFFQVQLGPFSSPNQWLPLFGLLFLGFLLNLAYFVKNESRKGNTDTKLAVFCFDAMVISSVSYLIGLHHSIYLLIFLLNIFIGNMVFSRKESWILVLFISTCFNILMVFTPSLSGSELTLSLFINNASLVAVNVLSGQISRQLKVAGHHLDEARSSLVSLQNFNDLIVSSIRTGVVVISRTGFIQYFNGEAEQIFPEGLKTQEKISEIFPQLDWEEVFQQGLDGGVQRFDCEIESQDQIKLLEVKVGDFRDESDRSKGWILLLEDRTEVKQLEKELQQKEKLAAVGQLAAGIAHEIRNPLASISGSIQMLSAEAQISAENKKLMNIVNKEIDRLNGLISEFLTYVRPEDEVRDPIDINVVLRECLEMSEFDPKLRKDVKKKVDLQSASMILGNRDKLKQAFLNFIVNAYQAMDGTSDPQLEVMTRDEREQVVLVIRDHGSGIKKENLERIFEPFHTTKPKGTGLGLAITHKILEAHKARVLVNSEEGNGTSFVIEFPSFRGNFLEFNPERKRA
ncbi:MAG TPA: hypothetical protein DCL41_07945 [Bdellovibrionales bacterium]|nr:hypothetical protein [Pseudobdellovibrionaceae bacterium]HAG91788.1 hypothetical protein [Bdellovibrionales bacterium]